MSELFRPFNIKNTTFRNRFVLPAMQRGWGIDYSPTGKLRDYYRRCVLGGVGLVISESTVIDHPSATGQNGFVLRLSDNSAPIWKECIDAVHEAGGRMLIQLWHEGAIRKQHMSGPDPSYATLSPSGLLRAGVSSGQAATKEELGSIRDAFVRGAQLAKALGADGIEVQGAHGYFLDQFLWHETNQRTDNYGGLGIEHRVRYPAEIVRSIRDAVGDDFLISFRFSQWKEVDYEARIVQTPDELKVFIDALKGAGVDIFHASTRRFYQPEWPGSELGLAGWIKSLSDVAVMTVGSVGLNLDVMDTVYTDKSVSSDVELSMKRLNARFGNGEFDMIAVGRSIMGDQQWVNKVSEGRFDEIVPFTREIMMAALTDWDNSTIRDAHKET